MEIFDRITPKEQETIKNYIRLYAGVAESASLSQIFSVWNKQKRTLYKGLGKKLQVRVPIEIPKNILYYQKELKAIYETYPIWDQRDAEYFLENEAYMRQMLHNDFVFEYLKFIAKQSWCDADKYQSSRLILHSNIEQGYINTVRVQNNNENIYHFNAFKLTIKDNMRTVRTIQKVLKAMCFPHMDLFEIWRNKISDININKDIKANLVFSIHPLDFMSMSDNNCDWSSCMSWTSNGAYSAGTIEMMNSNMAIIAYLESKTPYFIDVENQYEVSNKSWRILLYANKHIIVAGKAYPYYNENLIKVCLNELRKLLKKNLNWDYKYINQEYRDNKSIDSNFFLQREPLSIFDRPKDFNKPKHAIYLYSNCMYNDLIEYKDIYWCCRNWVPRSLKFCISGPVTCMCCGEYIEQPHDIISYDDVGGTKICKRCHIEYKCHACGKIKYQNINYLFKKNNWSRYNICDDNCLNNLVFFPELDSIKAKEQLTLKTKLFFIPIELKESWHTWLAMNRGCINKKSNDFINITIPEEIFYQTYYQIKYFTNNYDYYRYPLDNISIYWIFVQKDELWENQTPYNFIKQYIRYIPMTERLLNEISCSLS